MNMNGQWDDLLRRLTRRLGGDRELQLDIQQELRTHLEDTAAEFRDAGENDEAAAKLAMKALGDAEELEADLWRANRFRMRLRGLLWWAARATLIPAAVAVLLWLPWSMTDGVAGWSRPTSVPRSWRGQFDDDARLLLTGGGFENLVQRAQVMLDRWPDDPVIYAQYVNATLFWRSGGLDAIPLEEAMGLVARGRQLDPDNGYYDLVEAMLLLKRGSKLDEPESRREQSGSAGASEASGELEVTDGEMFQRGREAFERALAKGELTTRGRELKDRRLALLPESSRLNHTLWRANLAWDGTGFFAGRDVMDSANRLVAYAQRLAGDGRRDEAMSQLRQVQSFSKRLGAKADSLYVLMVCDAICHRALTAARQVAVEMPQEEAVRRIADEFEKLSGSSRSARRGERDTEAWRHSGAFWLVFGVELQGEGIDFEPIRSVEYAVGWEVALWWGLGLLAVLAMMMGVATLVALVRRKDRRPVLMFVGWGELGRICALAVVAPLGAYVAYAAAVKAWGGEFGMNYTFGRVLLELSLTAAAMVTLLLTLGYGAIRRRAMELGMAVRGPLSVRRRRVFSIIAAVLLGLSAIYIVLWWAGPLRPEPDSFFCVELSVPDFTQELYASLEGAVLAVGVGLWLLAWLVREAVALLRDRNAMAFGRSVLRNLLPVLATAVIVLGIVGGTALSRVEAAAARRLIGPANVFGIEREMNRPGVEQLRQALIDQPLLPPGE